MSKIKELVQIQSSYSAQVSLRKEFNDLALNVERMSNYRPIKAHRKAFEVIAEGAIRRDSKRCYVLSGSYGTGKSHLCLMAANYFSTPSDTPEMTKFFENYSDSETGETAAKAEQLKGVRTHGRYLVTVCDYGSNKFETYILKGLKEALKREGISEEEMDSYYLQAIKKIDEWKASNNTYFYERLEQELELNHQSWTINQLKEGLADYNKDAIEVFKQIHKSITTADFEYDKDNYVEIINQISQSKVIKEQFKGMVVFFDEFDYQLKSNRFDLDEFQNFAQLCAASFMTGFPIIFVATTHRSFASYKSVYNSEDFMTVSDRVREIPLATEGIEEIISAIVNPQKTCSLWQEKITPNVQDFNQLANESSQLGIFGWLSAPKLRKQIIENIYPMHPMATFSLLKLAEDVGSNNRSVFTFFADEKGDKGSYDWFVRNNEILNKYGELNFYTLDLLFDYFADKLTSDNQELRPTVREHIRNYETSLRELSKHRATSGKLELNDQYYERILRVMVIYLITGVNITSSSLQFALHANTENKIKQLEYFLKEATVSKVIYFNETNHCYEFRRSDAVDINGLIKEFKSNEDNLPDNWMDELKAVIRHDHVRKTNKFFKESYWFTPMKYNIDFSEDKRLRRHLFATVKELEGDNYFHQLASEMEEDRKPKESYEGICLYVICDTEDDIKRAKAAACKNTSEKVMVAIPVEEIPILDDIFSLKAATSLDIDELTAQDLGMLNDYISQYDSNLNTKLTKYIESRNLIYYGKIGVELSRCNPDNDEVAKQFLLRIYEGKRNKRKHQDLNLIHDFKETQNVALKEATEKLLDLSEVLYYRTDVSADRGDRRYFSEVLQQTGVIRSSGSTQGRVMCEIEVDSTKYEDVLPALASMIKEIKEAKVDIPLVSFINRYRREYGIGFNAVILFFAVVKRYFKDSLMIMSEVGELGSIRVSSYDVLLDLLYYQKHRNAVIRYKEIHEHDKALLRHLHLVFADSKPSMGTEPEVNVDGVQEVLKEWYESLSEINKVTEIYDQESTRNFIHVFDQMSSTSPRDFVLEHLKTIYGHDRQDLILSDKVPELARKLQADKQLVEQGHRLVVDRIITGISEVFSVSHNTHDAINEAINNWYENLDEFQRSYSNDMHNEESRPLVMHLGRSKPLEELVTVLLPQAYRLGNVKEWSIDQSNSLIEKVRAGKEHIEQNVHLVKSPELRYYSSNSINENRTGDLITLTYRDVITIEILPESGHKRIFITSNGDDPKSTSSQRIESQSVSRHEIDENKTIKFCAIDSQGRYSRITTVNLSNLAKKYEVTYVPKKPQQLGLGQDPTQVSEDLEIQVVLPVDSNSLRQCLSSIIRNTRDKYVMKSAECVKVLEDLIDEVGGE